ncbi:MAG TPA: BLUF domain-containing protein [Sphingomicrobium sp.]
MRQIAYFSTAAEPQTNQLIHNILITSRINNRRDQITGLLVAGGNRYMQIIEGPRDAVDRLYASIRADRRHLGVSTLLNRIIPKPSFDGWSMAFRSEPRLGEFDRFPDLVHHLTNHVEDGQIRNQIRSFARLFIADERYQAPAAWPEVRRSA